MTTSHIIARGCAPSAQYPLRTTVLSATVEELAAMRAFWLQQPERGFRAPAGDTRIPVPGVDAIDGTRALALQIISWAEGLRTAESTAAARQRVLSGSWAAPIVVPTTLAVADTQVLAAAQAAYCGDRLSRGQPIRAPFVYGARRWICVEVVGLDTPEAVCREIVPAADAPALDPGVGDRFGGRAVVFEAQPWSITCGTLAVTASGAVTTTAAPAVAAAPVMPEAALDVVQRAHDGALFSAAIGRYSGDLARWQLRIREPVRYDGRAWTCLEYTPDGQPHRITELMCREVVPLIDVDPDVATEMLCGDVTDAWTGQRLRDESGRFDWLVTPHELRITRDRPGSAVGAAAIAAEPVTTGEFPQSPAESPLPGVELVPPSVVVGRGRAVQFTLFA